MAGVGSSFWYGHLPADSSRLLIKDIQEGILTALVALASYLFVNNYPSTAKFLSPKERAFIHARLKADSDATQDEAFTWANVSKAFKDPKVWLYGLAFHTLSLPLYTLSLFLVS